MIGHHPDKFWDHGNFGNGDNGSSLSRHLTRSRDQRVMWLYGWEPLMVIQHPAESNDHRHCGSRNVKVLVCHVWTG